MSETGPENELPINEEESLKSDNQEEVITNEIPEKIETAEKEDSCLEKVIEGVANLLEIEQAKSDAGASCNRDMTSIDIEQLREELNGYPEYLEYFSTFLDEMLSEEKFFELRKLEKQEGVPENIKYFIHFIAHHMGVMGGLAGSKNPLAKLTGGERGGEHFGGFVTRGDPRQEEIDEQFKKQKAEMEKEKNVGGGGGDFNARGDSKSYKNSFSKFFGRILRK